MVSEDIVGVGAESRNSDFGLKGFDAELGTQTHFSLEI
jgi:hypothetical protein